MKEEHFICDCHSPEHQMLIWYDEDIGLVYAEVHLSTYKNFWKRLREGIRCAFGYKSRFGCFDSFIFSKEGEKRLRDFLNGLQCKEETSSKD